MSQTGLGVSTEGSSESLGSGEVRGEPRGRDRLQGVNPEDWSVSPGPGLVLINHLARSHS